MQDKIIFFDTTLRDGDQAPGAAMTEKEKVEIAKKLDEMGVDVIESGFAASSNIDFSAINEVCKNTHNATICSLARCVPADIKKAAEALMPAITQGRARIHVFLATSSVHMEKKLKMSKEKVKETIRSGILYARKFTPDVEFSAEDAAGTDRDFLIECVKIAIEAGAKTINIPDTLGRTVPSEYAEIVKDVITRSQAPSDVIFSVHCHNDMGNATANAMAGVSAGARQVECCMNGLGERAGNTALEEVVAHFIARPDLFPHKINIDPKQLRSISKMVSRASGFTVQKNKAIVGKNAFSHASVIHQDGILKDRDTYEFIKPEYFGAKTEFPLTRHCGRGAARFRCQEIKPDVSEEEITAVMEDVKKGQYKICEKDRLNDMLFPAIKPSFPTPIDMVQIHGFIKRKVMS